jgi:serine/threonine protein phosphatase PrpC
MQLRSYSAVTHQGPFLEINEDGYDFDLDNQLFMVIDGFGGAGIGDKAVVNLKEQMKSFIFNLSDDPEATMPLYWSPKWILEGNALVNAMINAHQQLFKSNSQLGLNQRAGASMACAIKAGDTLVVSHVGSTQVYLSRHGNLMPLFTPDTLQHFSVDPVAPNSLRLPLGAFGFFPELSWQMKEIRLREGDKFIFLTEGISPWISITELSHVLARSDEDGHDKLNDLLKLSNERGNVANQTGMILEF